MKETEYKCCTTRNCSNCWANLVNKEGTAICGINLPDKILAYIYNEHSKNVKNKPSK